MPIKMNDLWVIGALESLKERVVENFRQTWTESRIHFLYDKVKWEKNEVPFWVRNQYKIGPNGVFFISNLVIKNHFNHRFTLLEM